MINITALWVAVRAYAYQGQKQGLDGAAQWEKMKAVLSKFTTKEAAWNPNTTKLPALIASLGLSDNDNNSKGATDHKVWEQHHFFVQHGRIPTKEASLARLMQVAYNAGNMIYRVDNKPHIYTEPMLQAYSDLQLDQIHTYMNETGLELFGITDDMVKEVSKL
jgi:hypothetical protein